MTASADARPPISNTNGLRNDYALKAKMDDIGLHRQGTFKRHKVLPHPRNERVYGATDTPRSRPRNLDLEVASVLSQGSTSQASISSVSLRRTPRRAVAGPDPPPTPPAHSRTSSSSHSVVPSSPTYAAGPVQSSDSIREPPLVTPVTPTNQRSPPTPNLTPERSPPAKADRRPRPRPVINDRIPSKATTDSRTESFTTARENPESESEEDVKSTVRPVLPSARSSHSTVRQASAEKPKPRTVGLGLGMESSPEDDVTPRTKGEFMTFDGDWGSSSEVEQEWDDNLDRTVTVRKRRTAVQTNGIHNEVIDDVTVTPTNATKALRSVSLALQESPLVYPARRVVSDRIKPAGSRAPAVSESSISVDTRRASGVSSKSTVSTVVEAILVDAPPQRRKTLRHVRKQSGLRDSALDLPLSSTSSVQSPLSLDEAQKRPAADGRRPETRIESMASISTHNSISSRKARRAIEKSGGIPVVVIPDRRSSNRSSKEPSLRSTSSRRSKRSQSLGSAPLSQLSMSKDATPIFERPGRRSRTLSESDGSKPGDQRTMDFPPVVPARSSSLSAPTSRNGSRTASLTADSLKAHNALQAERARKALEGLHGTAVRDHALESAAIKETRRELPPRSHDGAPGGAVQQAHSFESGHHQLRHVDHLGDPFFGQRLSVQKTPFSLASVDTTGTFNAEVAEAQAVSIYPHQNRSVLVVDHSNKPSESSSLEQKSRNSQQSSLDQKAGDSHQTNPESKTTAPDAAVPVTPPQPTFKMDDVDSPLRNPRAPPEPPVIAFIPATPSGLTPAHQKEHLMGNYFGVVVEKPQRPVSLLKRALTGRTLAGRRFSESGPSSAGILSRTFSLSRHPRKDRGYLDRIENEPMYPTPEDRPKEENKLHAFWRPAYADRDEDDEDWVRDADEETYRYPPVDNRPTPRRALSLSDRVKRTFAILPQRDARDLSYDEDTGTARRTIRRTPSGNLRVVQHRRSLDSFRSGGSRRPYSPPGGGGGARAGGRLWRTYSLSRTLGRGIERYGLHNIPRRLSERRREKRSRELRQMISGPREVRDGVGEVIKRGGIRDAFEGGDQPR
ncbi:hypothetical protein BR93DRAFT_983160 [Coniochaeta sp. PMI_546]|nr:hypothetical protein BR93DRAFT_983160 [Coniochaeta sp. PMI_546]